MDIDAALKRMRELVRAVSLQGGIPLDDNTLAGMAEEMADLFEAMDGWLDSGGFKPVAWA